jgi:hypothetical protein
MKTSRQTEKGKHMRATAERAVLREDAMRLLDELGGTALEVAASLYSFGVKAPSSSGGGCRLPSSADQGDQRVARTRDVPKAAGDDLAAAA